MSHDELKIECSFWAYCLEIKFSVSGCNDQHNEQNYMTYLFFHRKKRGFELHYVGRAPLTKQSGLLSPTAKDNEKKE